MKTIYKFAVPLGPESHIEMDPGGQIVHVAVQGTFPMIWVLINTDVIWTVRTFKAFGTGWEIPPGWEYVGSLLDGSFVWHIHERKPREERNTK